MTGVVRPVRALTEAEAREIIARLQAFKDLPFPEAIISGDITVDGQTSVVTLSPDVVIAVWNNCLDTVASSLLRLSDPAGRAALASGEERGR